MDTENLIKFDEDDAESVGDRIQVKTREPSVVAFSSKKFVFASYNEATVDLSDNMSLIQFEQLGQSEKGNISNSG